MILSWGYFGIEDFIRFTRMNMLGKHRIPEGVKVILAVVPPFLSLLLILLLVLLSEAGYGNKIDLQFHDTYYVFRTTELIILFVGLFSGLWIIILRGLRLYPTPKWVSVAFGLFFMLISLFLLIQVNGIIYMSDMLQNTSRYNTLIYIWAFLFLYFTFMAGMMLWKLLPAKKPPFREHLRQMV